MATDDTLGSAPTKIEKRRQAWDRRLARNEGVMPGGKDKASCFSILMFSWIGPLVQLAYARPLQPENLYPLPSTSTTSVLLKRFEETWGEQLAKPPGQRSLATALFKMFKGVLIISGFLALAQQMVLLGVPLIVQQLLGWLLEDEDDQDLYLGFVWAVALFIVGFCGNGLLSNHYFLYLYVMGMDARTTLNGVTYAKSLRLSNKARQSTSTGELVTLMSNDAQRLPDMSLSVHAIWSTPLFIIIAVGLLVNLVGAAAAAGVAFLMCMIPIQGFLAAKQMGLQRAQMKQTEARVKVINEVLQGIRIVKYYAWEAPFIERISALRSKEVSKIKNFAFVNAYSMSIMLTTPFVMVMLTLIVYFNNGDDFSPDVVFTAVSLLLVIRFPLMMLPMAIAGWVQGKTSLERMQKFFELEELSPMDRNWTSKSGNGKGAGKLFIAGTYVWTQDESEAVTEKGEAGKESEGKDVKTAAIGGEAEDAMKSAAIVGGEEGSEGVVEKWDLQLKGLQIPTGKLVAVVGQVGSGKSSLVSAMLGEMTKVAGEVTIDGSVAYVAQTAWIINATLKENVLMGKPFDSTRYEEVLRVCDMQQDLAQLPAGDMTEIGEKGINLSGGQKQRVSIARAAYADADIYILDDPLSAVDAHVARHLFDQCLKGYLKGKTIILCANQLQFLSQTDRVVVINEGRITEEGPYTELLMVHGGGLAKLMEAFAEDDSGSDTEFDPTGDEESKTGEAEAAVHFGGAEEIAASSRHSRRSSRRSSRRISHDFSSEMGEATSLSVDTRWSRTVREASDTTVAMVEGWTAQSPLRARTPKEEAKFSSPQGTLPMGIMGSASVKRRRTREGSNRSTTSSYTSMPGLISTASRQYSNGSSASVGPRVTKSASAVAQEALTAGGALQTVEGREEGAVASRVFRIYFKDGAGGWGLPIVLIIVSILTQACSNAFDLWLSIWSDSYSDEDEDESNNDNTWYQYVYAALCVALVSLYLLRALLFAWQAVKSSKHLHEVLCRGVMRAPVSFFDTTPIGRVLNRFTKDMDSIDLLLPRNVPQFVATLSVLIGVMITIVAVLPWFLVVIVPVMFSYYYVQMYYRPINRDLQRLESVSRSPIFAQFSETLNGVSTLRAYNQQEDFIARNSSRLNDSSCAFYHMHVSNRWLGIRLEFMGTTMNLAAAILIVLSIIMDGFSVKGGVAGLVLTYTQQITGYLTWTVRMGCETEARITAVERAQEYADLTSEALPIVDDYRPPEGWPSKGTLTLEGIKMRYRPGLDLVLKEVNLDVKGGERVGIAGRTGSGKSSLMVTLFRIVEPCGGKVMIDGVDALRLGLQDLREAISIIPQDPVMFCGTMRENLDPFGHSDDVTIWAALEAARLSSYVSGLDGKLDSEVSEGGENLSLGQRQLVCLARAVLRRNKILVMDEATANVDVDTDTLIQEAIRQEFAGCTVLTIAHRLNTIMDSDRILVMQDGKVGEFDTPANLVANPDSLLMGFIRQTGGGSSRRLVGIANEHTGRNTIATDSTESTDTSPSESPSSSPSPDRRAAGFAKQVGTPAKQVGTPAKQVGTPAKRAGTPVKQVGTPSAREASRDDTGDLGVGVGKPPPTPRTVPRSGRRAVGASGGAGTVGAPSATETVGTPAAAGTVGVVGAASAGDTDVSGWVDPVMVDRRDSGLGSLTTGASPRPTE